MRFFFITIYLTIYLSLQAQVPKASGYEWRWAVFHPVAAVKVRKISRQCEQLAKPQLLSQQLDSFNNGGRADAFRHCFFMAAYAQKIRIKKLRKLGIAHEKNNYRQFLRSKNEEGEVPDSLGSVMDLQNNELGFTLGAGNRQLPLEELMKRCLQEIRAGKAVIMKRNSKGRYLDCSGKELDLTSYSHSWSIPKCLVSSGF